MATINLDLRKRINPKFQPLLYNDDRYLLLYGGAGSGKSHFCAEKLIVRSCLEPKHRFVVVRKTTPSVRDSAWALLKDKCQEWGINYRPNETSMKMQLGNHGEIYCRGLDKAEKLKSIERVTGFWFEEPTELIREDFRQSDLRLRGDLPSYKQMLFSFNPISRLHWLHKDFFEYVMPESFKHHSTYQDNQFIDEDYKRVLLRLEHEDENYYNIYTLGKWGELRALVYNRWRVEEFDHELSWYDHLVGGMDFGFNVPSAFALIGVKDFKAYIIDEIYLTHLTNPEFIEEVKKLFVRNNLQFWDVPVYSDIEPDRIQEFQNAGFGVENAVKSVPVRDQIDFVKRFDEIVHPRCHNFKKEKEAYKWKEDRMTGDIIDEPVKFRDHLMDSERYALYSLFTILLSGSRTSTPILGGKSLIQGMIDGY